MRKVAFLLILLAALTMGARVTRAQGNQPVAVVLNANGEVDAGMQVYIQRGIQAAEARNAQVLIIELDTLGGDIDSMTKIIEEIRSSTVPVVVYVAPKDANAGSAGALITMSGHISAMAPETVIGAASPVGSGGQELDPTIKAKLMEAMKAKIRPLVESRGTVATQLAQDMIDKARAVTATEALNAHLIDFIASDTADVLKQLDGRTVSVVGGTRTLHTSGVVIQTVDIGPLEQLLKLISQPNIVFILLALGVLALQVELTHPGVWIPGFVGVVALTLAIYGLGLLPVNWFGLIFMATAFVLFLLDIKAPTHGALTAAGVASFIVGGLVLFNSPGVPQFERVSVPLVVGTGVAIGLFFAGILAYAWRSQREPIQTGVTSLIGKVGTARSDIGLSGQVQVGAELWSAEAVQGSPGIGKGDRVEVVEVRGLHLRVRKI